MNEREHALVLIDEEAVEVAEAALSIGKTASKALRFGVAACRPGEEKNNAENLVKEVNDLIAAVEMLQELGVELPGLFERTAIEAKKAKVRHYMGASVDLGALQLSQQPDAPTTKD